MVLQVEINGLICLVKCYHITINFNLIKNICNFFSTFYILNFSNRMKQKKYRLEIVLNVREKKKDEATRFVALRRQELVETEQELIHREIILNKCRQQIFDAGETMISQLDLGTSAGNVVAHRNFIKTLKEHEKQLIISVEEQKINVKNAENAVEIALEKLSEAYKELKIIEHHKEKWQQNQKFEIQKNEQKLNDEIAAILHQRSEKL